MDQQPIQVLLTELTRAMAEHGFRPVVDLSRIPDAVLLLKRQTWNTNRAIVVVCPASPPSSFHDYLRLLRTAVAFRCCFLPVLWGIGIQVVLIAPGLAQSGIKPSEHIARFDNQWAIIQSIFLVDPDAGTHQEARSWGQYVTGKFQDTISRILFLRHAKALFIEAVRATAHLPSVLRERAEDVTALEMHSFDASYLEFLDTQILLSPRGPEWTSLLRVRRAALQPFCDTSLLRGRVHIGDTDFTVEIYPQTRAVIHWEQHDYIADAGDEMMDHSGHTIPRQSNSAHDLLMITLPSNSTNDEILEAIDAWVVKLEQEDYSAALAMVEHRPSWTPELLRKVIKSYGDELPEQRVTLEARRTDISQRKEVDRWDDAPNGTLGEVWYDLGINGLVSDLTATFRILPREGRLVFYLTDVHVM